MKTIARHFTHCALFALASLLLLALANPSSGRAAPGALDTTFGTGGIATTLIGTGGLGYGMALQSDGKALVAGHASIASKNVFALARYTTAGVLGTTFNSAGTQPGVVTTPIGSVQDDASCVAVQSDGKILAGVIPTPGPAGSSRWCATMGTLPPALRARWTRASAPAGS